MPTATHPHSIYAKDRSNAWVARANPVERNLFNEATFYPAFTNDMLAAKREIIIYSPFVSKYRSDTFNRILYKLKDTNINVFIFTRPVSEYAPGQRRQAESVLRRYEEMGASVYYLNGSIHEKVAVIDREILWEGSLNILSQRTSKEMMRRIADESSAMQVIAYLGLSRMLAEGYRLRCERLYRSLTDDMGPKRTPRVWASVLFLALATAIWWIFRLESAIIPVHDVCALLGIGKAVTLH